MTKQWMVAADDTSVLWKPYEERLAQTTEPRRRQVLETIIEHLRTESGGDLEGVMKTVAPDAAFRSPWGPGPQNWDEVKVHYEEMFANGGIGNMSVDLKRLVVDDDTIVNEYVCYMLFPARMARAAGYSVPDDDGHYAVWQSSATVLPFDPDGLLRGEITYTTEKNADDWKRVPDEELSPGYLKWLAGLPEKS